MDRCHLGIRGKFYMTGRGFSESTLGHFQVGEIEDSVAIFEVAIRKFGWERIYRSGLGGLRYWGHRVLFPFLVGDRIAYIQGRALPDFDTPTRYINPKGIPKPIYNGDLLKKLRAGESLYVCEGVPDTIAAYEYGYAAIGILGASSFRSAWSELLSPFNVCLVPHRDPQGRGLARQIKQDLLKFGNLARELRLAFPPGSTAKDLADLLRTKMSRTSVR
jgi:DNA primase